MIALRNIWETIAKTCDVEIDYIKGAGKRIYEAFDAAMIMVGFLCAICAVVVATYILVPLAVWRG